MKWIDESYELNKQTAPHDCALFLIKLSDEVVIQIRNDQVSFFLSFFLSYFLSYFFGFIDVF